MQQEKQREQSSQQQLWLPEGRITLEPFLHPREKRQRTSLVSESSKATSQQISEAGLSIGADGSNNDACKDSNESSKEPESLGVCLSNL